MKISIVLILFQLFISVNCKAQNQYHLPDSLSSSFERINRDIRIPCQFGVKFSKRENGKPFFTTKDSAQLEFDFFNFSSVPFYNPKQTILETARSYYGWILQRNDTLKAVKLAKIYENKDYAYLVYNIKDVSGEFYQLIAREGGVLFSIKIFGNKMLRKNQLSKLELLYLFNKN